MTGSISSAGSSPMPQARKMKVYTALDTKMSALTVQNNDVAPQMKMLAKNSGS